MMPLLVWDSDDEDEIPKYHFETVLWTRNSNIDSCVCSLPVLVEQESDEIKNLYLELIFDLGETKVSRYDQVIDFLQIRPGFSYWWMTLLAEKCNYAKSPQIDNLIKLIAFKRWLITRNYIKIILVSGNDKLAHAMELMAAELKIGFEWRPIERESPAPHGLLRKLYSILPEPVKALSWLVHYLTIYWPLKGVGLSKWRKSTGKLMFASYLFSLDEDALKSGKYGSSYWKGLLGYLRGQSIQSNWLHVYEKNKQLPDAVNAKRLLDTINTSSGSDCHVAIQSFFSVKVVISVLHDWFVLQKKRQDIFEAVSKSSGCFWPLLRPDLDASFAGNEIMSRLLFFSLIESAMSQLPTQKIGFYLLENQPWESALIYSWQHAQHHRSLIGIPHSVIRYWDLRHFSDPRVYLKEGVLSKPLPDRVALNGNVAFDLYASSGIPSENLIKLEALRYMHLLERGKIAHASDKQSAVLVLGDYLKINTDFQMKLLSNAVRKINNQLRFVVKPHPNCPIDKNDYPDLDMVVVDQPVPELIHEYGIAFTSCRTTAAVEAYCAGLSVITAVDQKALNPSPLKGVDSVVFVNDGDELAEALSMVNQYMIEDNYSNDFFYLDQNLPRWKMLIRTALDQP